MIYIKIQHIVQNKIIDSVLKERRLLIFNGILKVQSSNIGVSFNYINIKLKLILRVLII